MSTLLTSMETIVNPTPWLDRPRNAAKVMATVCTAMGAVAAPPSIYGILFLWPLLFTVPGYALLFAYCRVASGKSPNPGFWWNLSITYNTALAAITAYLAVMDLLDGGENLHTILAILAWQLFAIHLSLRGLRADNNRSWSAI